MIRSRLSIVALGSVLCAGAFAGSAQAASTRYVATAAHGGNDGANTCLSIATPCLTVTHAVSQASSGDTIQIGPGRFPESVSATTKSLTFAGAGAGTAAAFNSSTQTFIDAAGTTGPGVTIGNHDASFRALRIRGGVGSGTAVEPAIFSTGGVAVPALSVAGAVLLQANPASPGSEDYAVAVKAGAGAGANVSVTSSAIAGLAGALRVFAQDGTLTVTDSTLTTPAPAQTGPVLPLSNTISTDVPTTIDRSAVVGITTISDAAPTLTVTRTVIDASGRGIGVSDGGNGPTLTVRDSVIEPASGTLLVGVGVGQPIPSEVLVPSLFLTFDSVLAISGPPTTALSVVDAAAGTHVHTRNTILRAIDASGGSGANDIASGSQAINWDLGYTAYTHRTGIAVPAPGSGTNVNADPLFAGQDNLRLTSSSPLFDRGDPALVQAGETDVAGAPRSVPHVCFGTALPDLGAFEASARTARRRRSRSARPRTAPPTHRGKPSTPPTRAWRPHPRRSPAAAARSRAAVRSTRARSEHTASLSPQAPATARRSPRPRRTRSSWRFRHSARSMRPTAPGARPASSRSSPPHTATRPSPGRRLG